MNTNSKLCLECDGEGSIPDTGKHSESFRICNGCDGKGYVNSPVKLDKTKPPTLPFTNK